MDTNNQNVMTEIDLRDQMVAGIRRAFFGPLSVNDIAWPGSVEDPKVVNDAFDPEESRPIGPWVSQTGEEILDQLPHRVYGTGVLFSSKIDLSRDLPDTTMELDDDEGEDGNLVADPVVDIEDESDDDALQLEKRSASVPQSMSFSVRIPIDHPEIHVQVGFGSYKPITVKKQSNSWWERESHSFSKSFDIDELRLVETVTRGGIQFKVGVLVRPPGNDSRIVTVWVQNDTPHESGQNLSATSMFQVRLSAQFTEIFPYVDPRTTTATSLDLLYRENPLFAIGHGCDVSVTHEAGSCVVRSESLPAVKVPSLSPDVIDEAGKSYSVGMIDLAEFNEIGQQAVQKIIDDYQRWIDKEEGRVTTLAREFQTVAAKHISDCRIFLENVSSGWNLVKQDEDVRLCLQHASEAMNRQRVAYNAKLREVTYEKASKQYTVEGISPHNNAQQQERWRPFQIAFILANIVRAASIESAHDDAVDVIWMPTGGGKTEAYLGLSAFVILWERRLQERGLRDESIAGSTKVLMRYTYRLLTVQQLTRAASLICAMEVLREKYPSRYGTGEVRIGCWLGRGVTPNSRKQAVSRYNSVIKRPKAPEARLILSKCPWCGAKMGDVLSDHPVGYRPVEFKGEKRILLYCPDQNCHFSYREVTNSQGEKRDRGIPLIDTDEDLYDLPPDFVVATIDKVAMMSLRPQSGRLFGIHRGVRKWSPPALLIQDELHLITGSLGSLDGNFETMIEQLCLYDGGRKPLIIASTATTKNYEDQIQKLYSRDSRIIPPPGLDIGDSFFAKLDHDAAGKLYVGLAPTGFVRPVQSQTGLLALLTHLVPIFERNGAKVDPYWTNVAFFSSRRALGMSMSSVEESFRRKIRFWRQVTGLSSGSFKDGKPSGTRNLRRVRQITATASEDVNQVLDQLGVEYPHKSAIDLCYATSMVEVGLDVPRLGLMTVMGQPKSSSQYIQVTGRVGRQKASPALVVVAFNPNNVRDRSHYETFGAAHQRLYASVESASVTPYTTQALDRSLRSVVTVLLRVFNPPTATPSSSLVQWDLIAQAFINRAQKSSQEAALNVSRVLSQMKAEISASSVSTLAWDSGNEPFLFGYGDEVPIQRLKPHWKVMTAMRSVDADSLAAIWINAGVVSGSDAGAEDDFDEVDA